MTITRDQSSHADLEMKSTHWGCCFELRYRAPQEPNRYFVHYDPAHDMLELLFPARFITSSVSFLRIALGFRIFFLVSIKSSAEGATHSPASARSVCTAAAVASLRARFSHSCGINVSVASLGRCARKCERYHGLFSLARGPWLPARPCLQVPLDCGQGRRAGSWCLGPRNVCTRPGVVGFPVRRAPPGRLEERDGRSEERNGRSEERNGRSEGRNGRSEERNGRQPGSACRWPQVFHTQAIRLRPMTLFNPVFNCVTP